MIIVIMIYDYYYYEYITIVITIIIVIVIITIDQPNTAWLIGFQWLEEHFTAMPQSHSVLNQLFWPLLAIWWLRVRLICRRHCYSMGILHLQFWKGNWTNGVFLPSSGCHIVFRQARTRVAMRSGCSRKLGTS